MSSSFADLVFLLELGKSEEEERDDLGAVGVGLGSSKREVADCELNFEDVVDLALLEVACDDELLAELKDFLFDADE